MRSMTAADARTTRTTAARRRRGDVQMGEYELLRALVSGLDDSDRAELNQALYHAAEDKPRRWRDPILSEPKSSARRTRRTVPAQTASPLDTAPMRLVVSNGDERD